VANNLQLRAGVGHIRQPADTFVLLFNPLALEAVETTFLNCTWSENFREVLSVPDKPDLSWRVVIFTTSLCVIKSRALSKEKESKTIFSVNVSWSSELGVSVVIVRPLPEILSVLACFCVFGV
jgi:hypothetical protein